MAVAHISMHLAALIRSGVPMVDGLRVIAPTTNSVLNRRLRDAADRVLAR